MRTYFGGFVFGGGDEVGAVGGHLEVGDLHAIFVGGLVDDEFARLEGFDSGSAIFEYMRRGTHLCVVLTHGPILVPRDNKST